MSIFNERTVYDLVEDSILSVIKEAIVDRNTDFLARGLPIIAVAEELDPIFDEEEDEAAEDPYDCLAIASFDDSDPLMFLPKVLHLNAELVEQLSEDDLNNLIKRMLMYDERYIEPKHMVTEELSLVNKDGDPMDDLVVSREGYEVAEDEDEDKTASSKVIDFSAIEAAVKAIMSSLEAEEEAEERETTARVDKYKLSEKDTKIKTIVSKENKRYSSGSGITDKEYEKLLDEVAEVQDILDSAIESSGMSKVPSDTPDKRLNIRNVVIGHHKEYFSHKMMYGKTLDVVMVLDRSGSMSGAPARDSAILITALNNLTHLYKELTCTILFSDDSEYDMMNFPVGDINSRELLNFTKTHGAEGIAENMDKELERLEKADVVFVYTDGDICSGAVDKPSYTAKGIELTGLYTATSGHSSKKLDNEDYKRHYNKNKSWFHNVIVSTKATDLAEHMVDYMVG